MRKTRFLQIATFAFLAVLPLQALDQAYVKHGTLEHRGRAWVEDRQFGGPAREGGRLILRADVGSVVIRPGAANQVEGEAVLQAYTGSEAEARRVLEGYQLTVRKLEGGGLYVTGESADGRHRSGGWGVDFEIKVPQRFNLDVETQGGDISLEAALQGEARLTTAGGDVRTSDISGLAKLETAGGSITLGKMGSRVDARTAGGSVRVGDVDGDAVLETSGGEIVTGQIKGTLRAETAGGDVVVAGATGQVVAQTAGGQIQIGPAAGSVRMETAGGSIRLQSARGRVVAETAGGSIDLLQLAGAVRASTAAGRILAEWIATNAQGFGPSQLENSMGDVYVYLPVDFRLTIDAAIDAAAGHRIVSDFPISIQSEQEEFAPRTIRGRGTLNGGGEVLRIRTVSGNIEIRKLDARALEELKTREESAWSRWQERRAEKEQRRLEREQERRARQMTRKSKEEDRDQERRERERERQEDRDDK
jgi:DUF4097 and DUF4098 domain-containing protein YvlB